MENIDSASLDFIFHCRYEKNLSPKTIKAYSIDLSQFKAFIKTKGYSEIIRDIDKTVVKEFLQKILINTSFNLRNCTKVSIETN